LQQAYTATAAATPEIVVDSTRGALTLRDAAIPIAANLFEVQSNNGLTNYFAVTATGTSVTGALSATGAITFSSLNTVGIVHNNASGVLSTSALNLAGGANEVSGILPVGNG